MEIQKNFPEEPVKDPKAHQARFLWHLGLAFILWMLVFGYNYTWKGQYLHIHMERWLCLGQCAVYDVDIYGSGLVIYNGKLWVKEEGRRFRFISQWEVQDLISQMETLGYFSLENYYSWGGYDAPWNRISVKYGNKKLAIYHDPDGRMPSYDLAPPKLGEFEGIIENIVIGWVGER